MFYDDQIALVVFHHNHLLVATANLIIAPIDEFSNHSRK